MQLFANLQSKHGHHTTIGYDFRHLFQKLAESGEADVGIVSTEDGFSPLGLISRLAANPLVKADFVPLS